MTQEDHNIIIGIDLGTTNSEVALVRNGKMDVLEIENGHKQLPSYVGLDDQGALLIGEAAKNQYSLYPERTIKSIKRKMGEDIQLQLGEQHYSPQEISAMILRRLKQIAEKACGEKIERAVITVPAFFSDAQRQATRDAGEIAGLKVDRIINEPTAGALAYEANSKDSKIILIYDLGGGTFDVSVVRTHEGIVEVLSSHGNNSLGGDDFDQKIIHYICQHIQDTNQVDVKTSAQALSRITHAAEKAKIALSLEAYCQIEEEYLLEHNGNPVHLSLELSRNDYEELINPFVDETLEAIHIALNDAKLQVSDLSEVFLVGGSTKTPLVQKRLEADLGIQPRWSVDPDLCVAMGAAIQAGMISGESVSSILVDITPYTYGISTLTERDGFPFPHFFVPLIKKNTPLPVTYTDTFETSYDYQDAVKINVYQGEHENALENTEIGLFTVKDLAKVPRGDIILVTFSLDINGLLNVTAQEKKTGLEKSLIIKNVISRFEEAEIQQAKETLKRLMESDDFSETVDDSKTETRERVKAKVLLEKTEQLLIKLDEDDKEDTEELIKNMKKALKNNDSKALEEAINEMTDLLYYLSPNEALS